MKRLFILGFICLISFSARSQQDCVDCTLIDPNAICFTIWDPVCGCDGVTYSNDCVAINSAGVTYWEPGECPNNNVSICSDLAGVDFGACDMVLGIAVVNGECVTVSGCSAIDANGVDYSSVFTANQEFCEQNCLCGGTNGLNDLVSLEFAVIPNPVVDEFKIEYRSAESLELSLVDLTGRTVKEDVVNSHKLINVNELKNGVYILTLRHEGKLIHSQRIWKGVPQE